MKSPPETFSQSKETRLFPTEVAARYLGMSLPAFRKNVYLRRIPGLVRIGGRNYFDKRKLDAFIEKGEAVMKHENK